MKDEYKMPLAVKLLIAIAILRLLLAMLLIALVIRHAHWSVALSLAWVLSETETAMLNRVQKRIKDATVNMVMEALK